MSLSGYKSNISSKLNIHVKELQQEDEEEEDLEIFFLVHKALSDFSEVSIDCYDDFCRVVSEFLRATNFSNGLIIRDPLFVKTCTIDHLIDIISSDHQNATLENKVKLIYALSLSIYYFDDNDIDLFSQSFVIEVIANILNSIISHFNDFENENIPLGYIEKIIHFFYSLACGTNNSCATALHFLPFYVLFDLISSSNITEKIKFLIFELILQYYKLPIDQETSQNVATGTYKFLKKNLLINDYQLPLKIIYKICLQGNQDYVSRIYGIFDTIFYCINKANEKTAIIALKILINIIENEIYPINELSFETISNSMKNPSIEISVYAFKLAETMIKKSNVFIPYLLRYGLLNNIKWGFDQSVDQKIASLNVFNAIAEDGNTRYLGYVVKSQLLFNLLDLLDMQSSNIVKLVLDILYLIVKFPFDNSIILGIQSQITQESLEKIWNIFNMYDNDDEDEEHISSLAKCVAEGIQDIMKMNILDVDGYYLDTDSDVENIHELNESD